MTNDDANLSINEAIISSDKNLSIRELPDSLSERIISLTPNPTSDRLNIIGLNTEEISTIQIYDIKSSLLTNKVLISNNQIDVSKLESGTYFCKIGINNSFIMKKFVKL